MSRSPFRAHARLVPGAALVLSLLAALLTAAAPVAAAPAAVPAPTSIGAFDYNRDGVADVLAIDASGDLLLHAGDGRGGFAAGTVVGSGWLGYQLMEPGDFNGDGRSDLLAITPDGSLVRYDGTAGGFAGKRQIGIGWGSFRTIFAAGDLDGDGTSDIAAIARNGDMHLYRGSGTGLVRGSSKIGHGWQAYDDVFPGGDFNGDGRADIFAKDSSGHLFAYYNRGGATLSAPVLVATGWSDLGRTTPVGDVTDDGATDYLAVSSTTGRAYLYPATGRGGFQTRTEIVWGASHEPVDEPVDEPVTDPETPATRYPGTTTIDFPTCPSPVATRTGEQSKALYQAKGGVGTWMLDGAVFADPSVYPYPVRSEDWGHGCIVGGRFDGPIPKSSTRDKWYNGIGARELKNQELRITMNSPTSWVYYQGQQASDMEDVFDPNGPSETVSTYVSGANLSDVRDDCVENEKPVHNFYMNNSYMECFTAFAERPSGSTSGGDGTAPVDFVVENSLVHLKPQPLGPKYCSDKGVERGRCLPTDDRNVWLGAYGIWKWSDEAAANVEIRDTIFRIDTPSYSSCSAQQWPTGTYENVTIVWFDTLGQGAYGTAGDCTNTLPAGVRVTTDTSVWDDAVADWRAQW